jgi:hypothetical protein
MTQLVLQSQKPGGDEPVLGLVGFDAVVLVRLSRRRRRRRRGGRGLTHVATVGVGLGRVVLGLAGAPALIAIGWCRHPLLLAFASVDSNGVVVGVVQVLLVIVRVAQKVQQILLGVLAARLLPLTEEPVQLLCLLLVHHQVLEARRLQHHVHRRLRSVVKKKKQK